ncbi:MAG: hypothetical protein PHT51_01055 [Patescibacteria group bacterium]|nr:hypothetical protein [Patescibacteria group bacterium]MDD4610551.1 hypothetical protein [Patescibacteria group bacterium]
MRKEKNKNISYSLEKSFFALEMLGEKKKISYPSGIWDSLPSSDQKKIVENYIYSRVCPFKYFGGQTINYNFPRPFFKKFIEYGIINDLPRLKELCRGRSSYFTKKNAREIFVPANQNEKLNKYATNSKKAIIAMSFGKDSLLSYGLAKEIGLDTNLVYVRETEQCNKGEAKFKKIITTAFAREQKEKIYYLTDDVDEIFFSQKIKYKINEFENTNSMLAFTLELLPFALATESRYIIYGNEQNFNNYYRGEDGRKIFQSFDQTSFYTNKENEYLKKFTGGQVQIASLVEPLFNIAEFKILFSRYDYLLPYLMSCLPEENDQEKWCYHCSACADSYLFCHSFGIDPKKIGFKKDFFQKKYLDYYSLFNGRKIILQDKTVCAREQQLLAFLLAYYKGSQGEIMELFKKTYLKEAQEKEKMLRQKFFSPHSSLTIPREIKNKLFNIFNQELKSLL